MLTRPVLARCDNRAELARTNLVYGEPDQWMTYAHLSRIGLSAVSFDYFVDWGVRPYAVGNELWVKRIAKCPVQSLQPDDVLHGAHSCGDDLEALEAFAARYGFNARYLIFQEAVDWQRAPEPLLVANLVNGVFSKLAYRDLGRVMDAIRRFSGGPVRIGEKGLTYGTSELECHLSKTDALWPGDADCVLWCGRQHQALALLEFKKHNMSSPLADENIQKYMRADWRKWQRLGLLRDRLEVPLFCVYYSTDCREEWIKVERLVGRFDSLQDGGGEMISIARMTHADIAVAIVGAVTE